MKTNSLWIAACAVALALTGCTTAPDPAPPVRTEVVPEAAQTSAEAQLEQMGFVLSAPQQIVEGLEALPVADRPEGLQVMVTPTEVLLQPQTPSEQSLPLNSAEFYLSLAPYMHHTHPCEFHVPTSCEGELQSTDVALRVTDAASGELIMERQTRTEDNGFVGIWLPRNRELMIEAAVDGASGRQLVRTRNTDPTCITTLQLRS